MKSIQLSSKQIKTLREVFDFMVKMQMVEKLESSDPESIYRLPSEILVVGNFKTYFDKD